MEPSPPTLQLRLARATDSAKVAQCYLASRRTMHAFAPPTRADAGFEERVRESSPSTSPVTVAIESGAVVGFIAVSRRPDGDWM